MESYLERFKRQLEIGQKTESQVYQNLKSFLKKEFNWNIKKTKVGKTKAYDFEIMINNHITKKFEVKEDFLCGKTGNVAVEYSNFGKPNGISSTEADFWIYRLHIQETYICDYLIRTTDLGKLCCENDWEVKSGGNGNKARMFLIPVNTLISIAQKISN